MSFDFWIGFTIGSVFPGAAFLAGLVWGWFKYFSGTAKAERDRIVSGFMGIAKQTSGPDDPYVIFETGGKDPGTKEQLEKMTQAIKRDMTKRQFPFMFTD